MDFNEEIAKELIGKYNLSLTTLKVWKTRNRIPDKYADESYEKLYFITDKADEIKWKRVASILKMDEINTDTLIRLIKSDRARIYAATAGKSKVTTDELLGFIKEIKRLKIDITKWTEKYTEKGFMDLISDKRLKLHVIVPDEYMSKRLAGGLRRAVVLYENDFLQVRDYYLKLAIQLNVS